LAYKGVGFGGSGIREADPEWVKRVPPDNESVDPEEVKASRTLRINAAMDRGMSREEAEKEADRPREPLPPRPPIQIDLSKPQRCIKFFPKPLRLALYQAIKERLAIFKTSLYVQYTIALENCQTPLADPI